MDRSQHNVKKRYEGGEGLIYLKSCSVSFPKQISETHGGGYLLYIAHACPLGGVDVPFGIYEL